MFDSFHMCFDSQRHSPPFAKMVYFPLRKSSFARCVSAASGSNASIWFSFYPFFVLSTRLRSKCFHCNAYDADDALTDTFQCVCVPLFVCGFSREDFDFFPSLFYGFCNFFICSFAAAIPIQSLFDLVGAQTRGNKITENN